MWGSPVNDATTPTTPPQPEIEFPAVSERTLLNAVIPPSPICFRHANLPPPPHPPRPWHHRHHRPRPPRHPTPPTTHQWPRPREHGCPPPHQPPRHPLRHPRLVALRLTRS